MRACSIAILAAVLTLPAAAPAAAAPNTGSALAADVGTVWVAGSAGSSPEALALATAADRSAAASSPVANGSAANGSAPARRCRSVARRRLARVRGASLTKRQRVVARRRARTKLRRCLAAARRIAPPPPVAGAPPVPQPPSTPTPGGGTATPGPSLPSFVGVTASDDDGFRLTLSRPAVAAGAVTIELRNTDSGPHDLVVEPDGAGDELARFDPLEPGSAPVRRTVTLPAGRWRLLCSLPNHALAGMEATLRAE